MKASARKIPAVHQLAFVNRFPACRVPKIVPAELLAPPNVAAIPPPCPACISTTAMRTMLSRTRRTRRKVYIDCRLDEETFGLPDDRQPDCECGLTVKYHWT